MILRWKRYFGRPQCKKRLGYLVASLFAVGGSVLIFIACMQYIIGAFNVHYGQCIINDGKVEKYSSQYGSYWYCAYSVEIVNTNITNYTAVPLNGYDSKTHANDNFDTFIISNDTIITYPCLYTSHTSLKYPKSDGVGNLKTVWIGQDATDFAKKAKLHFYSYLTGGCVLMVGVLITCLWASCSDGCCSTSFNEETVSVEMEETTSDEEETEQKETVEQEEPVTVITHGENVSEDESSSDFSEESVS